MLPQALLPVSGMTLSLSLSPCFSSRSGRSMDNALGWKEQVRITQVGRSPGHQSGEDPGGTLLEKGLKSQYSS